MFFPQALEVHVRLRFCVTASVWALGTLGTKHREPRRIPLRFNGSNLGIEQRHETARTKLSSSYEGHLFGRTRPLPWAHPELIADALSLAPSRLRNG